MPFYLIDKPSGITSNYLIKILKDKYHWKKVGHSGTLDPFATGLIILATNNETKLLSNFLLAKKTYSGEIVFGVSTDTMDSTGKIIETINCDVELLKLKEIIQNNFLGKIIQTPPQYSAKKINGKHAYEYARKNIKIHLNPETKEIYSFEIIKKEKNIFSFVVEVSSGTYIRKLAFDLGKAYGVPSMLSTLRREKVNNININQAQKIDENLKEYNATDLLNINFIYIDDEKMKMLLEGKEISFNSTIEKVIFVNNEKSVLSIKKGENIFSIKKRIS